jgi:hypothetical protein
VIVYLGLRRVARAHGETRRSGAVLDSELGENPLEIFADRPGFEAQNLGDLGVGFTAGQPTRALRLAAQSTRAVRHSLRRARGSIPEADRQSSLLGKAVGCTSVFPPGPR